MKTLILIISLLSFSTNLFALAPEKHLEDETQEQRAIELFKEVKCLVCQGQSIHGSNTEFSVNIRKIIRSKISEGLSNNAIKNHLEDEFGKQILFSPGDESKSIFDHLPDILPLSLAALFLFFFNRRIKRKSKK